MRKIRKTSHKCIKPQHLFFLLEAQGVNYNIGPKKSLWNNPTKKIGLLQLFLNGRCSGTTHSEGPLNSQAIWESSLNLSKSFFISRMKIMVRSLPIAGVGVEIKRKGAAHSHWLDYTTQPLLSPLLASGSTHCPISFWCIDYSWPASYAGSTLWSLNFGVHQSSVLIVFSVSRLFLENLKILGMTHFADHTHICISSPTCPSDLQMCKLLKLDI